MSNELTKVSITVDVDLDLLKKVLSLKPKIEAYKNADSIDSLLESEEFISDSLDYAFARSFLSMQVVCSLESQSLDYLLDSKT